MGLVVLRLIIFVSLSGLNCKAAIYENNPKNLHPSISQDAILSKIEDMDMVSFPYGEYHPDTVANQPLFVLRNHVVKKTGGENLKKERVTILKAASNVIKSKSIGEMIKRFKKFSRTFSKGMSNKKAFKPFNRKFGKRYKGIMVQGKSVFEMAEKLEKQGKKKNKKQLDTFKTMVKNFTKSLEKFTKAVSLESKKQKNKSLKILKNNPNDIGLITNAKRCLNLVDLVTETIRVIGSIPSKISCLIFGNCDNNEEGNGDEDEEGDDGDDSGDNDGDDDGDDGGDDDDDDDDS